MLIDRYYALWWQLLALTPKRGFFQKRSFAKQSAKHGLKKNRKRAIDKPDEISGAIAQLGERYDGIVEVRSSILLGSTKILKYII